MDAASIGPYRIVDRLGKGGMGEVFLAFDTRLGRKVALKSLSDPALDTPQIRERLLREARAAAHITHPNIAAIYDVLDACEPPCIVMEYAQGETLANLASRGPMACADVMKVALQLVDAVAHAHASGVIHRDLKPANVVLTPDGVVKVLDFGLARVHDVKAEQDADEASTRDETRSRVGAIAGTTAYMAPELFAGKAAGKLSDIYGLGATLYELLTGRRPFEGRTNEDLVYQILSKPTPRASAANPAVPATLAAVVARAMAKDMADRYESAEEMAADLRQAEAECRHGGKTASRALDDAGAGDAGQSSASRTRRLAVAATVLAGVTLVVTVYILVKGPGGEPPPGSLNPPLPFQAVAVLPFEAGNGEPASASEAAGFGESVIAALEGLSAVSVSSVRITDSRIAKSPGNLRERALQLGATMIVGGRVSRSGAALRYEPVVETQDGKKVCCQVQNGSPEEAETLQRRAILGIVGALNVPRTTDDLNRLKRTPACQPDTYVALARRRTQLDRLDVDGSPQEIYRSVRQAVDSDSNCALAWAALADTDMLLYTVTRDAKRMSDAESAIDTAYRLDPVSPTVLVSRARFFSRTGRRDEAEKAIGIAIRQRPNDDAAHVVLADVLRDQDQLEMARGELLEAIKIRPRNVVNWVALGNLQLEKLGQYEEARRSYEKALEIQPDNLSAASNRCATFYRVGDYTRTETCYLALLPTKDSTVLGNLGATYYYLERFPEAIDFGRRAVEADPNNDFQRRNLADAYQRVGNTKGEREQLRAAADLTEQQLAVAQNRNATVMARHAYYHARLGNAGESVRHAEAATTLSPNNGAVAYKRAVVHCLLKQDDAAIEWLGRAIEKGFDAALARGDTDLDRIRNNPKVQELLAPNRQKSQ
jgi:eukaryotic-like serine/threonine-protein kinase